jgi:hypothetical protein
MRALRLAFLVLATAGLTGPVAHAQTLEEEQASETTTTTTTTTTTDEPRTVESGHELSDDQAAMEEAHPPPISDNGIDAVLDETNRDYFSFGVFGRGIVIPGALIGAFVNYHGGDPLNGAIGGYFAWRKNGLSVIAEVGYVNLAGDGYYRGMNAADTEMEYVRSQLGVVSGSFVFQWAIPITAWFSVDLGIGIGLGGVTGNLYRQEAYPDATAQYGYAACSGVGSPNGSYCEGPVEHVGPGGRLDDSRTRGGTYQSSNNGMPGTGPNPFYFGDGGVPPIFGWLELPRVTARFTPIRQLQIRLDVSYNLYGVAFGGSLGYQI